MSNTPIQVTTDLKEYLQEFRADLNKMDSKLDKIDERLNKLEVGQARLESDVSTLKEDMKDLKGSTKAQVWTLIGILGTALIGTVVRYIIIPFPKP